MSDQSRRPAAARQPVHDCTLAEKVEWLLHRLTAGDEAIETHFAWVFLTGDRAYKLRKPVRRDPMDYGSLDARRRDSEAEVRLNRRLAPQTYLGIRALTRNAAGELALGGDGEVVDWLVEMRRLDRTRMLDERLRRGSVTPGELQLVADWLAAFYARETPAVRDGATLAARLRAQLAANRRVLDTLDATAAATLHAAQATFLRARHDWLQARAADGCVVEAHGDLRPEHILLDDPPAVIDCLEFDRNLRILDRAEELEFLALECARPGYAATGEQLARRCLDRLGDAIAPPLQRFYRSHRAATRAKLCVWRAREPDGGGAEQWLATAREYLGIALAAVRAADD